MEAAAQSFLAQPAWAYNFCYYYLVGAIVVALYGAHAIFLLLAVPSAIRRLIPATAAIIAIILGVSLSVILCMMEFWICRAALSPTGAKAEKFAVKCGNDADCHAVGGVPQPSTCACGGRGLCGGCVMQNNMEPQASFASEFAPIEGFRNVMPPRMRR